MTFSLKELTNSCFSSLKGALAGQLVGGTVIAFGKIWTVLFCPQTPVSHVIPFATPGFRRELTTFLGVALFVYSLLQKNYDELFGVNKGASFDQNEARFFKTFKRIPLILTALALGAYAASCVTRNSFHRVIIPWQIFNAMVCLVQYAVVTGRQSTLPRL